MTKKIMLFISALILCGAMQAQNYHWSYNYHDYESNFPLIGEVYINGEVVASSDFEIAAFVGDQVRATEFLFEADPTNYPGRYYAWLGVAYNNAGETVTFKLYDHATETEYDDCSTTVVTNANGYGEKDDPVIIEFTVEEPISYGPEYPWIPGSYENFMYLETQIQINGIPVTNTNWEVGAFCGEECRGLGDADNWWVSPVDQSNILEIVVGGATGDVINFYLYDVTNQEVYPAICNIALDWIDDDIGDMFEPFVLNFMTEQTFTKDITAYSGDGGWYFIASPVKEDITPSADNGFLTNNYDLYYFNQDGVEGLEWINWKNNGDLNSFDIENGKGYLYASGTNTTLSFTGTAYNGNGEVDLTYSTNNADVNMHGWNLVGNPFAQTAYINVPFYTLDGGSDFDENNSGDPIEAMQGVLVKATEATTLTFSTTAPAKSANLVMNITQNRGSVIDRAIVRFGEGRQLPKFMINENHTKLYIPQDNKDYAVVNANENGEMPVNFKAETSGTYTISVGAEEMDFRYLHLIDNQTGADVNLLENPNYTFNALTTDYASRFKLVFVANSEYGTSTDSGTFAFMSNDNWIINNDGDAILQVIDVNGRIISSESISGCVNKHIEAAPGVYMLRLISGTDMKVQKIVVR